MALSKECLNRLHNYKFNQAENALNPEATQEERAVVTALSDMFGNPGWFVGEKSSMAVLISFAIDKLGREAIDE